MEPLSPQALPPFTPEMVAKLKASADNPAAHSQDNFTTSLLRLALSELFSFMRSNAVTTLEQLKKRNEEGSIYFPDEDTAKILLDTAAASAKLLNGYKGLLIIHEDDLRKKLMQGLNKNPYCMYSPANPKKDAPYLQDCDDAYRAMGLIGADEHYTDERTIDVALHIALQSETLIPIHKDEDGKHYTFLINVVDWTGEYLNLSVLFSQMSKLKGPASLVPIIEWIDSFGVLSRAMYINTLHYKKSVDELTIERDDLSRQVSSLKMQTTGAPGLSWQV